MSLDLIQSFSKALILRAVVAMGMFGLLRGTDALLLAGAIWPNMPNSSTLKR